MNRKFLLAEIFLIITGMIIGCSFNPSDNDRNAIEDIVNSDTAWFKPDGHYGDEQLLPAELTAFDKVLVWYRYRDTTVTATRNISVDILNDSAYVTISGTIPGILHIKGVKDTDTVVVDKPFVDEWTRAAIFKRDTVSSYHSGWRLYAITGAEIKSDQNDIAIDSVKIVIPNSGIDTVITDIMAMVPKGNIVSVRPGDTARVTLYTNRDDAYTFLHSYFFRWKLVQDSVNHKIYYGEWRTPLTPGIHRIAFDILSHGSLADDSLPYDSNVWGLHYIVTE